jgi:hypothetical protein
MQTRFLGALLVMMGAVSIVAAGCVSHGDSEEDDSSSDEQALTGASFADDFGSYATGTNWRDGSVHGPWTVVFNGYGSVGVELVGTSNKVMHLRPATPTSAGETHAALLRSNASFGDLEAQIRMKTVSQLRSNPNAWEQGWIVWHYTDPDHFYYLVLKANGWELGKRDPAYPGGQRFLATGGAPTYPAGTWHTVTINQVGSTMSAVVDGRTLTSFTDAQSPYTQGSLGLYSEDAHVHFDNISVRTPSAPGTSTDAGGTVADAGTAPSTPDASLPDSGTSTPTPSSGMVYGVTVDDVSNLSAITTSLGRLAHKPTTRIVFDEFVPASDYVNAVNQISTVSFTMGELLDSFYVKQYSVDAYLKRTDEYLAALGSKVDIWEVGNEINGEWLGDTPSVVAKVTGAYDKVKAAGKTTGLTLYYNQGCWERSSNEMFAWTQANIPDRMKQGLDYVLVSYYEDDCNGLQPDWNAVFTRLAAMFPNSKLGMGECGTDVASKKAEYVQRYYTMKVNAPRYIGGNFWWYFRQDMVPYTSPLWSVLNQSIQ